MSPELLADIVGYSCRILAFARIMTEDSGSIACEFWISWDRPRLLASKRMGILSAGTAFFCS
jgi:hypothetical protein